jgi:hypothetical protein
MNIKKDMNVNAKNDIITLENTIDNTFSFFDALFHNVVNIKKLSIPYHNISNLHNNDVSIPLNILSSIHIEWIKKLSNSVSSMIDSCYRLTWYNNDKYSLENISSNNNINSKHDLKINELKEKIKINELLLSDYKKTDQYNKTKISIMHEYLISEVIHREELEIVNKNNISRLSQLENDYKNLSLLLKKVVEPVKFLLNDDDDDNNNNNNGISSIHSSNNKLYELNPASRSDDLTMENPMGYINKIIFRFNKFGLVTSFEKPYFTILYEDGVDEKIIRNTLLKFLWYGEYEFQKIINNSSVIDLNDNDKKCFDNGFNNNNNRSNNNNSSSSSNRRDDQRSFSSIDLSNKRKSEYNSEEEEEKETQDDNDNINIEDSNLFLCFRNDCVDVDCIDQFSSIYKSNLNQNRSSNNSSEASFKFKKLKQ